jgi:hypothetical protein
MNLVAMEPCRLLDTRASAPLAQRLINGPIPANIAVEVPIRTSACGIPATALGYSLNITVDTAATGPLGFLSVWPTGSRPANLVSVLNATNGGAVANAAATAAGANGSIDLFASNPTHVIIDVNGYYASGSQGPVAVYRSVPGQIGAVCLAVLSTTPQDYSVREVDTDNAVTTGASWRFTAPVAGHYSVTATLDQPFDALEFALGKLSPLAVPLPDIRKVGVNAKTTTISTVVNLLAGESLRTYTNNATSCGGRGWISIHYVRP